MAVSERHLAAGAFAGRQPTTADAPPRLFFVLEGTGWLLFALFNTLYFGLGSPVLGALDTTAGLVVGIASLVCCLTLDRRAAWLIVPRVLWLLLATYVSVSLALNNPDPLFGAA